MPKKKTTTKKKAKAPKKTAKKKLTKKATQKKATKKPKAVKYIQSIGRRKTSVARVRFYKSTKEKGLIIINKKEFKKCFPELELQNAIEAPLKKTDEKLLKKGKLEILVRGGGKRGQADAIQLGIARIILKDSSKLKTVLKSHGFLTRDPRKKERKKFGLKKARKAPQWQKR
jgi:small subunit ribosomal protein S9